MPALPSAAVTCESVIPGFIVANIHEAIRFYRDKLGFRLNFTWGNPTDFAGMAVGDVSLHLIQGVERVGKSSAYFIVGDVDSLYEFHRNNGVNIAMPIANKPYDMRDYYVADPDGNFLGFGHYVMSTTPALKIERTDVHVRLEKRLAALLMELADLKGMTPGSLFEETFLHSFERYGKGVASPHTEAQLRQIDELKTKHSIDYDTHASYRFVE